MFENLKHYNKEIERAVIGQAILVPTVTQAMLDLPMRKEYFYDQGHQLVFDHLKQLCERGSKIDLIILWNFMLQNGHEKIGPDNTAYFLARCTNWVVSSTHLYDHCAIIRGLYEERQKILLRHQAVKDGNIESLKRMVNNIAADRRFPRKEARYLLKHVEKSLIKKTADKYGAKTIPGAQRHRMQVANTFLVYFMHLVEPAYTWTVNTGDEVFTTDQVKSSIPKGAILCEGKNGTTYWADPEYKFPAGW